MKTALICLVAFLTCGHSAAPLPKQVLTAPVVTINWSSIRWKILAPCDVDHPETWTATRQEALFALECTYQKPADWQFIGYQWTWLYPPASGTENPADALPVLEAGKTNRYATGIADRPGIFRAQCTATFKDPNNVVVNVTGWGTCAVVGGPITIGIVQGDVPTWEHDSNDVENSWFLEYFDYAHTTPQNLSQYVQSTQDCYVAASLQPEGTEITWDVPPDTYSYILLNYVNPGGFDLSADAPFIDEKIAAFFELEFYPVDNGVAWTTPVTASGDDDTTASFYRDGKGNLHNMVSSISAHRPTEMVYDTSQANYPAHPPGADYCGADYWYILKDQEGEPFPGVWINERFPDVYQLPPFSDVNGVQQFWWSILLPIPGRMDRRDWLRYVWPTGDQTVYEIDHQYWAASKLVTGTTGVLVYEGVINLVPGQPGIAIQSP